MSTIKSHMGIALSLALLAPLSVSADDMRHYKVTITNASAGQVLTPAVVFSHGRKYSLFELGQPADEALVALAEDGVTDALTTALGSNPMVGDVQVGALLPPGASHTLMIKAGKHKRFLSLASMLASTNDGFTAANGMRLPKHRSSAWLYVYDAGSEANNESCDYIPGPPCGNPFVRDTDGAEGMVTLHGGLHGNGENNTLNAAELDWRGPVARITIERMHH